jgi:Leucine-rich repeat (LRR) protein
MGLYDDNQISDCLISHVFPLTGVASAWTNLKFGTGFTVPGWFTARGWLGDSNLVCTNWWGITCNSFGQVEKIELNENGLTGYLPPETALLHDSLKLIDLFKNMIHNKGNLGNDFLGELTNLEYLFYGRTNFENDSGIPSAIGKLTKLQEYDCSYTIYSGPLKGSTFAPLTNLNYLVMDGNTFNSVLPEELITLPELKFLYAGFSNLEGDLEFIHRMPKIYELWLDDNPALRGTIPTTIGLAKTLASFSATGCELFGPLPTELGAMMEMERLWLYDNMLTGDIPTQLTILSNLRLLNLQKNDLLGQVPKGVCDRFIPFGRLEEIEADCLDENGTKEVTCSCCTCCGEGCIDYEARARKYQ